jgi:membrane-associated phospholipid phosphatase
MIALTSLAFVARLPHLFRGTHGTLRAASKEAALAFHNWLPLSLCSLVYENLHDLTFLIRKEAYDNHLMAFDQSLFHVQPTLWIEAHLATPLLTDLMVLGYGTYFFLPAALLLAAYRRGDQRRFRTLSVAVLLVFLFGFLSYVLIPVIGPRYHLREWYVNPVLSGRFFSGNASEIFGQLEAVQRDCFPSLHTALSGVSLYYAWRWRSFLPWGRLWLVIYAILAVSIWASTIYLRQHWVGDVFAGWLLAALVVVLAPLASLQLSRKTTQEPQVMVADISAVA